MTTTSLYAKTYEITKKSFMRRRLGQHFLKDKKTLERIAEVLDFKKGEVIVEVGPGHGELTHVLSDMYREAKIVAVEKDGGLVNFLKKKFSDDGDVEIIEGDILKLLSSITYNLKPKTFKIVGNIPYYITGQLLRLIEGLKNKPKMCVFMLQKEVAERIASKPPRMNKLSASVQFWADIEIVQVISRKVFSPPPDVDSAIIRLRVLGDSFQMEEKKYYKMVKVLFKQPRKTILNNLTDGLLIKKTEVEKKLKELGLDSKLRPQNLEVKDIVKVSELFESS